MKNMTPAKIKSLQPGEIAYDSQVPGLHVKAYASMKSFYLYYRSPDGVQRRPKIADCAAVTLSQARAIARERLYKIAKGEDPNDQKKEITVGELFDKIWAEHWATDRFKNSGWGKEAASLYHCHIKKEFSGKVLSQLTPMVVKNWHRLIKRPFSANRALSVLSKMITFAEENELKPQNQNPCRLVRPNPERKRSKFASPAELIKIHRALQKRITSHPAHVAYIYTILYTGARPKSFEQILWQDVTEQEGCGVALFSGKSTEKTGDQEMLIIPAQIYKMWVDIHAKNIIHTLTPIKMPRRFWREICAECGIKGLWARDLRRTFATIGFQNNDLSKIGEVLNHKSTQTTLIYAKLNAASRIATVSGIAKTINVLIGGEK